MRRSRTAFSETWRNIHRERRAAYQKEGRAAAGAGDPLHLAGCMLYWAEGSKRRGGVRLVNSDPNMVVFFRRFLTTSFGGGPQRTRGQPASVHRQWPIGEGDRGSLAERPGLTAILSVQALDRLLPYLKQRQEEEQAPVRGLQPDPLRRPYRPAHVRGDSGVRRVRGAALARWAAAEGAAEPLITSPPGGPCTSGGRPCLPACRGRG